MLGSVNGYVVRADTGQPVAGANVTVVSGSEPAPNVSLLTDDEGHFGFEGLNSGKWHLRVLGPNGSKGEAIIPVFDNAVSDIVIELNGLHRWLADALTGVVDGSADIGSNLPYSDQPSAGLRPAQGLSVENPARPTSKTEQRMTKGIARRQKGRQMGKAQTAAPGTLRGRVVLADTGMPVADAAVSVVSGAGAAPDIAPITDAAGRFSIDGLTPGLWVLRALGPNDELGEAEVRIYDNAPACIVIEVAGLSSFIGSIWGRVVLADTGAPVADATVSVVSGAGPIPDIAPVTDGAGRFSVDGIAAGMWVLRALNPDGQVGEADVRVHGDSPAYMVIEVKGRLPAVGSVRGRLLLADTGMPIADAVVNVVSGAGPAPDFAPTTDAAGWFSVDGLAIGTWVLSVIGPNGEAAMADVQVTSGGCTEVIIAAERPTFALDLVGRLCRIYREGDPLNEDIYEQRVNIELDREENFIRRVWFG